MANTIYVIACCEDYNDYHYVSDCIAGLEDNLAAQMPDLMNIPVWWSTHFWAEVWNIYNANDYCSLQVLEINTLTLESRVLNDSSPIAIKGSTEPQFCVGRADFFTDQEMWKHYYDERAFVPIQVDRGGGRDLRMMVYPSDNPTVAVLDVAANNLLEIDFRSVEQFLDFMEDAGGPLDEDYNRLALMQKDAETIIKNLTAIRRPSAMVPIQVRIDALTISRPFGSKPALF